MKKHILILMSIFGFLISCAKEPADSRLVSFEYYYNGSIGGDGHHYLVKAEGDSVTLTYEDWELRDFGEMTIVIDSAVTDSLAALCKRLQIYKWDGFDKTNKYVLDGDGFSLYLAYEDGRRVSAHGTNSYPAGYGEFVGGMDKILIPFAEKAKEEKRQEKIKQGVKGHLAYFWINLIGSGNSGRDTYEITLSHPYDRESDSYGENFYLSANVNSESEKYFPKGRHNYYTLLQPDDKLLLELENLIKKHRLVGWMNYDKTAEDYQNAEWFQMEVSFEEGYITAMGTEHPETYDAFRNDLLNFIVSNADRFEHNEIE